MDLHRLKELEKLAGFQLASCERTELLADLLELEKLASQLPEISSVDDDAAEVLPSVNKLPPVLDMDRQQVDSNAPSVEKQFFKTPPTNPRPGGSSS